jgi:hypothetical protein
MSIGARSRLGRRDGGSSRLHRSGFAGRPVFWRCPYRSREAQSKRSIRSSTFNGPYPLLAISGEQGSAKTVLSKLLKALIDPNATPVRALSREQRELMIAVNNSYLLAFDNLSGLPDWLSDVLCRLATGGSFAVRQLYTDDEEVLFEAARPILLNGIEEVVSRPDLGDRAIFLTLAALARIRNRAPAYPRRPAPRGSAWPAKDQSRAARGTAAHGRFRALGRRM